eukprot:767968-Hanusia_phi.AAC.9
MKFVSSRSSTAPHGRRHRSGSCKQVPVGAGVGLMVEDQVLKERFELLLGVVEDPQADLLVRVARMLLSVLLATEGDETFASPTAAFLAGEMVAPTGRRRCR